MNVTRLAPRGAAPCAPLANAVGAPRMFTRCRAAAQCRAQIGAASPRFAGADADGFLDRGDEDLAVADAAGAGGIA